VRHGFDGPGDLILGAEALEAWRSARQRLQVVDAGERARRYPLMAAAVLAGEGAGAQLGGETPKFTAITDHGGHLVPVLVKFSPPMDSPEGLRAGELLLAEHLAHVLLKLRGVLAAHSRVFRFGERVFLEVDRFDRVGTHGRRAVVPLAALELPAAGGPAGWAAAAGQLVAAGLLPRNDARQIRLVEAFSSLIGNVARDDSDLSLFHRADGRFALAPAYDLAPTVLAQVAGDARSGAQFLPPAPGLLQREVWAQAKQLAVEYWERLAIEPQLSPRFRAQCAAALDALRAAPEVVGG
jgi:serine/threonine protein kinase HipA of HipAB toxin-antitoxin module